VQLAELYDTISQLKNEGILTEFCKRNVNKGLSGLIIEQLSGLDNSSKNVDCEDGDLKTFKVDLTLNNTLKTKETIAISMINREEIIKNSFFESKYWKKISRVLFLPNYTEKSGFISVGLPVIADFTLDINKVFREQLELDYNEVRDIFIQGGQITDLTGSMGILMQPRTKGSANSISRAFYFLPHLAAYFCSDVTPGRINVKKRNNFWKRIYE